MCSEPFGRPLWGRRMRCSELNVDAAERFLSSLPLLQLHEDLGIAAQASGDWASGPHLGGSDKKEAYARQPSSPDSAASLDALCGDLDFARAERFLTSLEADPWGIEQLREDQEGFPTHKTLPLIASPKERERQKGGQTEFGGWRNQAQLDKMSPGLLQKGLVGGRIVMSIGASTAYVCSTRPYDSDSGGQSTQLLTSASLFEVPVRHTSLQRKWLWFRESKQKFGGISYREFLVCSDHQYDPNFLDDLPQRRGKHHTVMRLEAYQVSVIPFLRPQRLKEELNDQFRLNHPNIHPSMTLSKLRNLQKDLLGVLKQLPVLDVSTVAIAWAYFEILVLADHVRKGNRKLIAGACLVLAYKFHQWSDDSPLSVQDLAARIKKLDRHDQLNLPTLQAAEIDVFLWLKFGLHLPWTAVENHYKRFFRMLGQHENSYYTDQGGGPGPAGLDSFSTHTEDDVINLGTYSC